MSTEEMSQFDTDNEIDPVTTTDEVDRGDEVSEEVEAEAEVDASATEEVVVEVEEDADLLADTEGLIAEEEPTEPVVADTIPKARLDAELAKRRAVEVRLQEYEKNAATGKEGDSFDFDTKEEAYADAILDGDKELAKGLRGEIRQAELKQYQAENSQMSADTLQQATEQRTFDMAVQTLVVGNPAFDESGSTYDESLVERTNVMFSGYVNQGYTRADAIQMAADVMVGVSAPAVLGTPASAELVPKTVHSKVAEKVNAASKQPPRTGGVASAVAGKRNTPDVMGMSDTQFSAFIDKEPDTYHDLRGDFIA